MTERTFFYLNRNGNSFEIPKAIAARLSDVTISRISKKTFRNTGRTCTRITITIFHGYSGGQDRVRQFAETSVLKRWQIFSALLYTMECQVVVILYGSRQQKRER
jgi:acid phosphatase class B